MTPDEVREKADELLARKAVRQEDWATLRRAADAIERGEHSRDLADALGVFASFYYQGKTRQLTRAMYTTMLTWHAQLAPNDTFL